MTATWTYSAIIQEPCGDIREITFSNKQELEEYIGTCNKQVLFTRTNVEDISNNHLLKECLNALHVD